MARRRPASGHVRACCASLHYQVLRVIYPAFDREACHRFNSLPASLLFPIAAAFVLVPQQACASEWTIKPTLNFSESYSSNILRATRGKEQADWVTQLTPGLTMSSAGPRLKLNSSYQMQNLIYAKNNQRSAVRHHLMANVNTEIISDKFFIDGTASVSQQNTTPLGPQTPNNFNPTTNLARMIGLTASPYWKLRFQSMADGELRYTRAAVSSNATGLSNNQTDTLLLQLHSGHAFNNLRWGMQYRKQKSSYGTTLQTINSASYSGNIGYLITPNFTLTANAGQEKSDYISIAKQPTGPSYSAGFSWTPSQRTNITASVGHRFYGQSFSLDAKSHTRRLTWNLGYSEDVTTSQAQFLAGQAMPVPTLPAANNLLSNRVFLQKNLHTSATITGKRNTVTFNLFDTMRQAQTPQTQNLTLLGAANLGLGDSSKLLGGNAVWSSKISHRVSTDLTGGYTKSSFSGQGISSYNKYVQLRVNTQLQSDLSCAISLQHNQYKSSLANSASQESSITATLLMQF